MIMNCGQALILCVQPLISSRQEIIGAGCVIIAALLPLITHIQVIIGPEISFCLPGIHPG
ncbi:hypothetical protein NCCP2331_09130 [Sporosarcina sp. NCCP-2331]|nr:hypothetical protein NCCP2331_09130 [Sporosarcina sp. NCCP-2331]GLB54870.1 hypothetical protein NCCP2378_06550 [Sporosarcina sp. NCCP-2378]